MERALVQTLIAAAVDGLAGLAGGLIPTEMLHAHLKPLLAFAAGTLIGVAGLELVPEALTVLPLVQVGALVAAGWGTFAVIEHIFGMHSAGQQGHRRGLTGPFLLVGDALHNFTDGVALAIAFRQGESVGFATALAVVLHELPQEVGDYAILRAQGFSKGSALALLTLVQLTAIPGAVMAYNMTGSLAATSAILSAGVAGGFLYIAIADLLPEISGGWRLKRREAVALISGVALIAALAFLRL